MDILITTDLANILNKMGANVKGAGTETIKIVGVDELHGTEHAIIQDRIEAGTFMVAAALTKGNVLIKDAIAEHNIPLISKLEEMGVTVKEEARGIRIIGPDKLKPVVVKTLPHPGFPTDMQPQVSILQLAASGTSLLTETVFENRFKSALFLAYQRIFCKVLACLHKITSFQHTTLQKFFQQSIYPKMYIYSS